jgi:hypothetical protein
MDAKKANLNLYREDAGRNEFDAAYEMYRAAYGDSYP